MSALLCALARARSRSVRTRCRAERHVYAHVKSQLVVETVVVKDKQGNLVQGPYGQGFCGDRRRRCRRRFAICEHQDLADDAQPLPVEASGPTSISRIYNRLARTQIAPETPGQARSTRITGCWRSTST